MSLLAATQQLSGDGEVIANVFMIFMGVVATVAGLKMVTTKNVVHAALYLLVVLAVVAAYYVIAGAAFVAATQIMVYLGAIMVLLLFGVMLTRAKIGDDDDLDHESKWIGALIAMAMCGVLLYVFYDYFGDTKLPQGLEPQSTSDVAVEIFSTYIVAFEALSLLLLAALIGAIVIARRD